MIDFHVHPLETLLLELDVAGLQQVVLLPIETTRTRGVAMFTNEQIAELVAMAPERLIGFASVDPLLCSNCGQCIEACPYDARVLVPLPDLPLPLAIHGGGKSEYVQVVDVLCQGCGACVVACPNKASRQKGFELEQVYGMLDAVTMTDESMVGIG